MLIAILLSLAVPPASQAKTQFCADGSAIVASSEICMFNDAFVKQARACLSKLDASSNEAAGALAKALEGSSGGTQASKFSDSGGDYGKGLLTLSSLVAANRVAILEVEDYRSRLIHPLDDTSPMSVPCYGDNYRGLSQALEELQKKLKQLEGAQATATANLAASRAREDTIAASHNAPAAAHGKAGSAPVPRAVARPSSSDITGTKPTPP